MNIAQTMQFYQNPNKLTISGFLLICVSASCDERKQLGDVKKWCELRLA